jgi:hypothetical protein
MLFDLLHLFNHAPTSGPWWHHAIFCSLPTFILNPQPKKRQDYPSLISMGPLYKGTENMMPLRDEFITSIYKGKKRTWPQTLNTKTVHPKPSCSVKLCIHSYIRDTYLHVTKNWRECISTYRMAVTKLNNIFSVTMYLFPLALNMFVATSSQLI